MNYKEIQDEIISTRFDESRRDQVKLWIKGRYAALWASADWNFRHVLNANLAVVAGSNTPAMPADISAPEAIYDNLGEPLSYLEPLKWRDAYLYPSAATQIGPPTGYTVVNGQVYLGPTPQANSTFLISYTRRVARLDSVSAVQTGNFSQDTDRPIWSQTGFEEYDYILVIEAMMLGQQILNDPTAYTLQGQRDDIFQAMRNDLTSNVENEYLGTWGDYYMGTLRG